MTEFVIRLSRHILTSENDSSSEVFVVVFSYLFFFALDAQYTFFVTAYVESKTFDEHVRLSADLNV